MKEIEYGIFPLFEAEGAKTSIGLSLTLLNFFSLDFSVTKRSTPFSLTWKKLNSFHFSLLCSFSIISRGSMIWFASSK